MVFISLNGTSANLTVKDITTGKYLVVAVGPWYAANWAFCGTNMLNLPQVNFGTVHFAHCKVAIKFGKPKPFGLSKNLIMYVCYNAARTQIVAKPSVLAKNQSFSVKFFTWGP